MTPKEASIKYAAKALAIFKAGKYSSGAFFIGYVYTDLKRINQIEYFKLILKEYPYFINCFIIEKYPLDYSKKLKPETKEWLEKMSLLI